MNFVRMALENPKILVKQRRTLPLEAFRAISAINEALG